MSPHRFNRAIITSLVGLGLMLSSCSGKPRNSQDPVVQGWGKDDRTAWYYASQGSRMIPKIWFDSLEQPGSTSMFATEDFLSSFGLITDWEDNKHGLPIGFAVDVQADDKLYATKLRWYDDQKGGRNDAEPWVGLTCSACHTAEVDIGGSPFRVDGGPAMFDFQSFVESMDNALEETLRDREKWARFRDRVLDGKTALEDPELLRDALEELVAWQARTDSMNHTPLRYGFARVDAVGHILNKILMFSQAPRQFGSPADAPVSYPHLWNSHKQERVQWNGIASNGDDLRLEHGALARNAGEVIGVFGDLAVEPVESRVQALKGYRSSVLVDQLMRLESQLHRLESPTWLDYPLPPIDSTKLERGKRLFEARCQSCHLSPDAQVDATEKMARFVETAEEDRTDPWMACNAVAAQGFSGNFEGGKLPILRDEPIDETAQAATLLRSAIKGVVLAQAASMVKEWFFTVVGIKKLARARGRDARRRMCGHHESDSLVTSLLAYKARPLDGIWATAPYLHNGSVPSLYDLLQPATKRPATFRVGSRDFDPVKVGFEYQTGSGFLFDTSREGNLNVGHDYGASELTEEDRWALVEYLKTQ